MSEVYIIVADASQARVLHASNKTSPLIEIESLVHPEGRMHSRELTSDLPGRDTDRSGFGKHRLDSATEPKHHELEEFVRQVVDYLDDLVGHSRVDQLMMVAPPVMLGMLREKLPKRVLNELCFELDKNLTQFKPEQIRSYLPYFKPIERVIT